MPSVASHHFPQIVFRDGKKLLWNPILKNAYANRPEERVRLRILEYLILEAGWSHHRIRSELPVNIHRNDASKRADLLCYDRDFRPRLLVECKAEGIPINEKAGVQIARYNTKVNAPYLLLTNGLSDYLYSCDKDQHICLCKSWPDEFSVKSYERTFNYWAMRGFVGKETIPSMRNWLYNAQETFWHIDQSESVRTLTYLSLRQTPSLLNLEHYYKIFILPKISLKLAITFMATSFSGNRLVAIINRQGKNEAIIEVNLELMAEGVDPNTTIFFEKGETGVDSIPFLKFDFDRFEQPQLLDLPDKFLEIFNHYT